MSKRVDTRQYGNSQGHKPSGCGLWWFAKATGGATVDVTGEYRDVVKQLPAGEWKVLP